MRPCVALLSASASVDKRNRPAAVESMLIPRLDAKEVAAVFSAPLHNFLRVADEAPATVAPSMPSGNWYDGGMWTEWHEGRFRMHNFFVPVKDQVVTRPQHMQGRPSLDGKSRAPSAEKQSKERAPYPAAQPGASKLPYRDAPTQDTPDPLEGLDRFRVFGMTARILVDCARVAFGEEPEFEHNHHFGDEAVILRLHSLGRLQDERKRGDEFVAGANDVRAAFALQKRQQSAGQPPIAKL